MSNPNIGVSFRAKDFNAEVRSMKEELSGVKKEFQITDEQLKRTGGTIDQLKNKSSSYTEQLKKQSELSQKYRQGIDGYSKALEEAKERQKKATEELTKAQRAKDTDEKTLKKLNQEVQKANREVETYQKKLKSVEKELQGSVLQEEKLKTTLKNTNEELKKQESYVGKVKAQLEEYNKKTSGLVNGLDSAGNALTKGVTVPLVAAAGAAVKFSTDFNASLANISTLGVSTERVLELKTGIQELAVGVAKDTGDISNGVYNVISAIGDTNDTIKITEINAKAAAAGLATTEEAIGLTTAVTKGYNDITADAFQKASDLAFVTVKLGQTTFPELANAIGRVVPASNALGISQEELFTVYATLTGVTGKASEVSTQYGAILSGLMKPSDSMKKMLTQLGYESGFAMVKALGLKGTLDALTKATGGSEEKLSNLVSSKEAVTAMLALTGAQAENFTNKLIAMNDAAGASDEAFEAQSKGVNKTGFQFQQSMIEMQVAAQKFGDAAVPYIDKATDAISGLAEWLNSLSDEQREAVFNIGVFTAAIGPSLKITSGLIKSGTKVVALLKAAAPAATTAAAGMTATAGGAATLSGAMTLLTGPVGWTIGALTAITVGGMALAKGLDAAEQAFFNMGDAAGEAVDKLSECETRVQTVDEMAEKYANLKEQITSGKLTEQELEQAEAQRKETEQWFIDNYGSFISAEEEKNGIRDESITKIQQYVDVLRQQSELELEATVQENEAREPALRQEISDLQAENVELEKQKETALTTKIALLELRNEVKALSLAEAEGKDVTQQRMAVEQKAYELTGVRTTIEADIIQLANNQTNAIAVLDGKLEDNNQKIEDGTLSLEQNAAARKRLIEVTSGLNGSIEDNQEKIEELNEIQENYNRTGQLSTEKLDALIKKFPELAGVKDKPELLKDEIKKLEEGLQKAYEKANLLRCDLDGFPTDIQTNVRVVYTSDGKVAGYSSPIGPPLPKYYSSGGKITQPENAFVNDGNGLEFIEDKDGNFRYVASDGPALTKLYPGDTVYTAEESRRMMNARVVVVPGFASGTSAESQRKAKVTAYKNSVKNFEAEDLRWQELQVDYGRFSDGDVARALNARIKRYQNYMNEILSLDYMTVEEKDELLKEYSDKVEELQLKQWETEKKLAKEDLDTKLELSEQYVAQIARSGDLAGDSWESIIERVSSRYQKAVEAGVLTAEEAQKYINGFQDTIYSEKIKNSERWIEDEVFYGRLDTQGQIDAWMRTLQDSIAAGDYDRVREIEKKIYTLKKNYAEKLFAENLDRVEKYYDSERQRIVGKYDEIDRMESEQERAEEKSDILSEMSLYENAVTVEGKSRYNELAKQLQDIEKEEERERREIQEAEELERLERDWEEYQESQNKALEKMIQSYGMAGVGITEISNSVTGLISGVISRLNQMNLDMFGQPLSSVVNYNNYYQTNNQRIADTGLANLYAGVSINQFKLGV